MVRAGKTSLMLQMADVKRMVPRSLWAWTPAPWLRSWLSEWNAEPKMEDERYEL
jgi:hypothetical protein